MSQATKRKRVQNELLCQDYSIPEDLNSIVKIIQNSGNNLHQIETSEKENYLVSMPSKFRNNIWIKPGDYVIVKPIEEGHKVKGEIDQILDKKYIQYLKNQNSWPFSDNDNSDMYQRDNANQEVLDEEVDGNLNRRHVVAAFSDSSSDEHN